MTETTTGRRFGPAFDDGTRGVAAGTRSAATESGRTDDVRDLLGRIAEAGARMEAARGELIVLVAEWRRLAAGGGGTDA